MKLWMIAMTMNQSLEPWSANLRFQMPLIPFYMAYQMVDGIEESKASKVAGAIYTREMQIKSADKEHSFMLNLGDIICEEQ